MSFGDNQLYFPLLIGLLGFGCVLVAGMVIVSFLYIRYKKNKRNQLSITDESIPTSLRNLSQETDHPVYSKQQNVNLSFYPSSGHQEQPNEFEGISNQFEYQRLSSEQDSQLENPESFSPSVFQTPPIESYITSASNHPLAILKVVQGQLEKNQYEIYNDRFMIGRGREANLQILDERVSRNHAIVRHYQGLWFIQDQKSLNGIFVNGQKVNAARLQNGDEIKIADYLFRFVIVTES